MMNSSTSTNCNRLRSTREKGFDGEDRACTFLEHKGYTILGRNFRTRTGEIDIIALDGAYIVFVEVKSLPHGDIDTLAHELNTRKQQKIIETAKYYLQKFRQYNYKYVRFDVLVLDVPGLEPVRHLLNAFSE